MMTDEDVRESITYTGKNGGEVRDWVNQHGGIDGTRETWFITKGMSAPTGMQAWRYIKDDGWPDGVRAAVYDPRTGTWLPLMVGDIVERQGSGHGVRKPGSALYENGHTYVCTQEPYHENSVLIGVSPTLSGARELCGLPDPADWQAGDAVTILGPYSREHYAQPRLIPGSEERRLWYSTRDGSIDDTILQIVECPVFGPW